MVMVVGVELKAESCSDSQGANNQKSHPHQEFSPSGHRFDVNQIVEGNGQNGQNDDTS